MYSFSLKLEQLYPCTVCTSDSIQWLVHGGLLSWSTLVMTQHQQSLERLDSLVFEDKIPLF